MPIAGKESNASNQNSSPSLPKQVVVMRKNQKVARVSLCCKLNMLVPQLQRLSAARLQAEAADKNRNYYIAGN